MWSYRQFLMKGFIDAIGKMADFQIRLNAGGYFEKGVLTEEDLQELDAKIDEHNASAETLQSSAENTVEESEVE